MTPSPLDFPLVPSMQGCSVVWDSMVLATPVEELVTTVLSWETSLSSALSYMVRWEEFPDSAVTASLATNTSTITISLQQERLYTAEVFVLGPRGILGVSAPVLIDTRAGNSFSTVPYIVLGFLIITITIFYAISAKKTACSSSSEGFETIEKEYRNTSSSTGSQTESVISTWLRHKISVMWVLVKLGKTTELVEIV